MDFAPIVRNPISERAKFFFLLTPRSLISGLIGFQTRSARSRNSDTTSDRPDPPVQRYPRKASREGICHENVEQIEIRWEQNNLPHCGHEDYRSLVPP
jgi:hypothetical protein